MARPLSIEQAGGWYHLTSRGKERGRIFRDDRDRGHFHELLGELVVRFRWGIHSLRNHRWSSYRAYAGVEKAPSWMNPLLGAREWVEKMRRRVKGASGPKMRVLRCTGVLDRKSVV